MAKRPAYEDTAKRHVPKSKTPVMTPVQAELLLDALYSLLVCLDKNNKLDDALRDLEKAGDDWAGSNAADEIDEWLTKRRKQDKENEDKRSLALAREKLKSMSRQELEYTVKAANALLAEASKKQRDRDHDEE